MRKPLVAALTLLMTAALAVSIYASDTMKAPEVGDKAPNIKAQTLKGKEFNLKAEEGNLVLVDFWGTWCPPCRGEIPHLIEVNKEYSKKGLTMVSVSLNDELDDLKEFTKKFKMDWTHVHDADGAWGSLYQIRAVPTPILIDHTGKIVAMGMELRGPYLKKAVEKHLKNLPKKETEEKETE